MDLIGIQKQIHGINKILAIINRMSKMEVMKLFVKPKEGVLIRHPKSKLIMPAEGWVIYLEGSEGKYWARRLACGDITIINE
jgi:hypothetical protein